MTFAEHAFRQVVRILS